MSIGIAARDLPAIGILLSGLRLLERAMGIEPTSEAWEALNKTLKAIDLAALSCDQNGLSWKLVGNGVLPNYQVLE
jgi:hypothetical protein